MALKKILPFVAGLAEFFVLSLLSRREMYGYEILKELGKKGHGLFQFEEGAIYPILYSLEENGFVQSRSTITPRGKERIYYKLTDPGAKHLAHLERQWNAVKTRVDAIVCREALRAPHPA